MSAHPATSPASSQVADDQPKGKDTNSVSNNPPSEVQPTQPTSQDANHHNPVQPDDESSEEKNSAAPEFSTKSPESQESGEASPVASTTSSTSPGADDSSAPPLPNEAPPATEDDGWDFHWDATNQTYFFHNRFTNETTWENPRLAQNGAASTSQTQAAPSGVAEPPKNERLPAGGYNPAIHGDYDPNAWYAKNTEENAANQGQSVDPSAAYAAMGTFNRFTGRWQGDDQNPDRHGDEAKSRRQMNAFFDVDAAANSHDGRSLKAERSGKKPTKAELKQFKEKRRAKKEEKRRAWLRD
ncbi:uncharacterized protein F4822DRAFT_12920 [Hypoxylon trugodes]|uniref:uncharacterized protein n=1 Tax=Hypoxylon trugodes TaxID=326681 RepID=UPI00218FBE51|nr:uncharacterized protein F4822DRAFT_12920 [Hypoxylon trugodes]KAI1393440.1 hypothetical protein F4822DRAFT_12920 [Hypoxylon trugodes]